MCSMLSLAAMATAMCKLMLDAQYHLNLDQFVHAQYGSVLLHVQIRLQPCDHAGLCIDAGANSGDDRS